MDAMPALQTALYGPQGFTLLGVLVGFGILSLILVLSQRRTIQGFPIQARMRGESSNNTGLRVGGAWFNGDSLSAQAGVDENGDPLVFFSAPDGVILRWTQGDKNNHPSTYRVSGEVMDREYDGSISTLEDLVETKSVDFLRCGNLLTLDRQAEAELGNPPRPVLWTYLRKRE